jgi:hypothetical protein
VPFIPRGRGRRSLHQGAPWFTTPHGALRLKAEQQRIAQRYPNLEFLADKKSGEVTIEGTITLRTRVSGVPTPISLRIVLPKSYSRGEPRAYVTGRRFEWGNLDGHVLDSGKLCLWLDTRSPWQGRDATAGWDRASPDALLRFIEQVVVFCERYLVWEAGGKKSWPGGESAHGGLGYVEYVHEALGLELETLKKFAPAFGTKDRIDPYAACPCGSGKKYRFCHRRQVHELRRRCRSWDLEQDFARWIEQQLSGCQADPPSL